MGMFWTPSPGATPNGDDITCVTDVGGYQLYAHLDGDGVRYWRWNVTLNDGTLVASSPLYSTREDALKSAERDWAARQADKVCFESTESNGSHSPELPEELVLTWVPISGMAGYTAITGLKCTTTMGNYIVYPLVKKKDYWRWVLSIDKKQQVKSTPFATQLEALKSAENDWAARYTGVRTLANTPTIITPVSEPEKSIDPKVKQRQNFDELVNILSGVNAVGN